MSKAHDVSGVRLRAEQLLRYGSALVLLAISMWFLILPGLLVIRAIRDPNLHDAGIPRHALRLHWSLSPQYERWARERVTSKQAGNLDVCNISGTEWPVFGSVFYLWATEALQGAWEQDHTLCACAPADAARGAVDAAAALVADPVHAAWVREHWGPDYLHRENVFYRSLLIAGLTSHYRLTQDGKYLDLLRDEVKALSQDLDASPHGLLDDYPGECYPTDVLTAIACIRRADDVLGTDHAVFAARALRAFQGPLLDSTGLPPYAANSRAGRPIGPARGCGNSFMLTWAPELWPDVAASWYADYEAHFWQTRLGAAGFRDFPKALPNSDWYMDVDAGPVLAGYGFAACAFGVGAARANGCFDHAYPLSAEMLAISWPLPNGTLLGPRLLSDSVDAPFLGEAAILFNLTRQPIVGVAQRGGGSLPMFVYVLLALYFGIGSLLVLIALRRVGILRRGRKLPRVRGAPLQLVLWGGLCAAGLIIGVWWSLPGGLALLLLAQVLPRATRKSRPGQKPRAIARASRP